MKMTRKKKILITFYLISFVAGLPLAIELCFGDFNLDIVTQWSLGIISAISFLVAMGFFTSDFIRKNRI